MTKAPPMGKSRSAPEVGRADCEAATPEAELAALAAEEDAPDAADAALSVATALEAELVADDEAAAAAVM